MFSASLERVLNLAAREAMVRRHADLTIEHLLFAAAHDPEGEEILEASGADVERLRRELADFLEQTMQRLPPNSRRAPQQTLAFRRVLQTAVVHVQSAGKDEAGVGDMLAALLRETRSHAVELLGGAGRDAPGRAQLHLPRRAQGRRRARATPNRAPAGEREEEERPATDPLAAYASNLTERARAGRLDPVIGRTARDGARARGAVPAAQEQPGVRGRAGRRQDRDRRGPGAEARRGGQPRSAQGRRDLRARHRRAARRDALPRRLRGALQGRDRRRSRSGRCRSCSSTRCTPWSAPAPPPAAPWTSPT